MLSLFLALPSISRFTAFPPASKGCFVSDEEQKLLRKYVKKTALKEKVHVNTIWARLRRRYAFKRYKEIDCALFARMLKELPEIKETPPP